MTDPRLKKIRRLGTPLPGLTRKEARPAEGTHARASAHRRRESNYRRRLEEKQKVRWYYGITEAQMRNAFAHALREAGATGDNLLTLLESRLDNVVFRLGLAPTIPAARQLVSHGHVLVNGRRVDRASARLRTGDRVSLSERGLRIPDVESALEKGPEVRLPGYLALDPATPGVGRVVAPPARDDVAFIVDEAAIVEFYAR